MSHRIEILPPVQADEFSPTEPFVTAFNVCNKFGNPIQRRIPLLYGHLCPECSAEVVTCRDGNAVYLSAVTDISDDDFLTADVNRMHRCASGGSR